MRRRSLALLRIAVLATCGIALIGCGSKTMMDAYVLKDGYLAGDASKGIKPVRNILIWPLVNNAQGSKAKGIETKLTDLFVDKFYLETYFDSVGIVTPDRAGDLLTRAGEELGLKRKPKDVDSGLVAAKVGELAGADAVFVGMINDYDEDKVDKTTESVVSGTFFLLDAREKSYPSLDSFTPPKYLWRSSIKQYSGETVYSGRDSLDSTARKLVVLVTEALVDDLGSSQAVERRELERKIGELKSRSEGHLRNEEFDKATAVWNEILKLDPGNSEGKAKIEEIAAKKKEAEERKKAEALRQEIEGLKKEAEALEKDGKLSEAVAKWNAILEKDKEHKEASRKVEKLKARIAEEEKRAKDKEISKGLYLAQKSFDEKKYTEASDAAKKVLELDPENVKAKAILSDATKKIEEIKAAEEAVKAAEEAAKAAAEEEPAKAAEEPAKAAEEPAEEAPPAAEPEKQAEGVDVSPEKPAAEGSAAEGVEASGDTEQIRKAAMDFFDKEEYAKSRDEWKRLLEILPDDAQAKEMLETSEMLLEALQ